MAFEQQQQQQQQQQQPTWNQWLSIEFDSVRPRERGSTDNTMRVLERCTTFRQVAQLACEITPEGTLEFTGRARYPQNPGEQQGDGQGPGPGSDLGPDLGPGLVGPGLALGLGASVEEASGDINFGRPIFAYDEYNYYDLPDGTYDGSGVNTIV